jgi:uracil phosphoribosyltransferase
MRHALRRRSRSCCARAHTHKNARTHTHTQAIEELLRKGVEEKRILFLCIIAAPEGVHRVCGKYPSIKVCLCFF